MSGIYGNSAEDRHFENELNRYLGDPIDKEAAYEQEMERAEREYQRRKDREFEDD